MGCGHASFFFFFFSGLYLHSVFPSGTFSSLLDVTATFCRAACWCPINNSNRKGKKKNSRAQAVLFFFILTFRFVLYLREELFFFFFCFSLRNPWCDPIYRLSLFFSALYCLLFFMTFNFIFNLTAQETRQLIALYDVTCPVFFFFCVSKGKEGRRKQHRQVYVRLPLPLPLSISHVVLFTSKPISHACILCVFHRCQASVTFVCVCAFFFFSLHCVVLQSQPLVFFPLFFSSGGKKRGMRITVIDAYGMKKKAASILFRNMFFFFLTAQMCLTIFFSFLLFFFFNLPVWISDVHFTDLQPSSLILLFSSA